jgi:N-acylglucosamine-6-phosphate 2-epimerase
MISTFKNGLIVSCQAEEDDPFNSPDAIATFARAAEIGGAVGIRAEGYEKIKAIKQRVKLPVVGLIKGKYPDDWVLITPDFSDVEKAIKAGADIVALDVTDRIRPNGISGFDFFYEVRKRFDTSLIADVSTFKEGIKAAELGADAISTTLSGYTPYTADKDDMLPDYDLVSELSSSLEIPVIAEGRIWTPSDAIKAIESGAFCVVVGTAITRPRIITKMFVEALKIITSNRKGLSSSQF